jgi:tetratricopeptide (TPR) repeat protein
VLDLVHARIDDLSEEEKELLDVAACCGFEFDPGLVADAVGMRRIPALRAFGRMEKTHRLIRSMGRGFEFDHHQVQEVLYDGQPAMLREEYHFALGEALEAREKAADRDPKELDGAVALDLCEHFLGGAHAQRAVRYLGAALDHLESGYLYGEAISLAERGLSQADLVRDVPRVELMTRLGWFHQAHGNPEDSLTTLEEARVLADACGDTILRSQVRTRQGHTLQDVARFTEASAALGEGVRLAVEAGDETQEANALQMLAWVLTRLERSDEAEQCARRGLEIAARAQDAELQVTLESSLGTVLWTQGRFEEALEHQERARSRALESGGRKPGLATYLNCGNTLQALGRLREALPEHELTLRRAREMGLRSSEGLALCCLGIDLYLLGDLDAASDTLLRSIAVTREIGGRYVEGHALLWQAYVSEAKGEIEQSRRLLGESLSIRRDVAERGDLAESLIASGRLEARQGNPAAAADHLTEAASVAEEVGHSGFTMLAQAHLAALPEGDVSRARDELAAREERAEFAWRLEARLALWRATKDPDHLAEAHRLLEYMRDHAPEEYRDSMVENVPLHREVAAAWAEHGRE